MTALLEIAGRTIRPYDVLQIKRGEVWMDYATIRDAADAAMAVRYVGGSLRAPGAAGFRILLKPGFANPEYITTPDVVAVWLAKGRADKANTPV